MTSAPLPTTDALLFGIEVFLTLFSTCSFFQVARVPPPFSFLQTHRPPGKVITQIGVSWLPLPRFPCSSPARTFSPDLFHLLNFLSRLTSLLSGLRLLFSAASGLNFSLQKMERFHFFKLETPSFLLSVEGFFFTIFCVFLRFPQAPFFEVLEPSCPQLEEPSEKVVQNVSFPSLFSFSLLSCFGLSFIFLPVYIGTALPFAVYGSPCS